MWGKTEKGRKAPRIEKPCNNQLVQIDKLIGIKQEGIKKFCVVLRRRKRRKAKQNQKTAKSEAKLIIHSFSCERKFLFLRPSTRNEGISRKTFGLRCAVCFPVNKKASESLFNVFIHPLKILNWSNFGSVNKSRGRKKAKRQSSRSREKMRRSLKVQPKFDLRKWKIGVKFHGFRARNRFHREAKRSSFFTAAELFSAFAFIYQSTVELFSRNLISFLTAALAYPQQKS